MQKSENIEQFLLKSLLADLDVDITQYHPFESDDLKTASCTPKSMIPNKSQNSNAYSFPSSPFSKEEINKALKEQKDTLILQNQLHFLHPYELSLLLVELKSCMHFLMKDKNGNYFCKDLFKLCSPMQRLSLLRDITVNIIDISCNQFGTHPIQKLIELSRTKEEIDVLINIFSMNDTLIKLSHNSNGCYVIQKILLHIPEMNRIPINKIILENFIFISLNMYGVSLIKRYLSQCNDPTQLCYIVSLILQHFFFVAENQYGNYVIQFLLELFWKRTEIAMLKQTVSNCFVRLASNRFASHITVMYVDKLTPCERRVLYVELLRSNCSQFLMNDKYGLYVMNRVIVGIDQSMLISSSFPLPLQIPNMVSYAKDF